MSVKTLVLAIDRSRVSIPVHLTCLRRKKTVLGEIFFSFFAFLKSFSVCLGIDLKVIYFHSIN